MVGEQVTSSWVQSVQRLSSADFIAVDFQVLPSNVAGGFLRWSTNFLNQAAIAPNPAEVRHSVHFSDAQSEDLVRHEYDVGGEHFVIIESSSHFLIEVSGTGLVLSGFRPSDGQRIINSLAESIVNMHEGPDGPEGPTGKHSWFFQPHQIPLEGAWFSTNPEQDPMFMNSWADRADAAIQGRSLLFLGYKKYPQIVGFYGNPKKWFKEDFRQKYQKATH